MYSVIGYDKDNDVYVNYGDFRRIELAFERADRLKAILDKGELKRVCSDGTKEPIDWIELYENYNTPAEKLIWASYKKEEMKEISDDSAEIER